MDWLIVVLGIAQAQVIPVGIYPYATEKECKAALATAVGGMKKEMPKDFLYVAACLPVKRAPGPSTGA